MGDRERHKPVNPKNRPPPPNWYLILDEPPLPIVPGYKVSVHWSIYFPESPEFDLGTTLKVDVYLDGELVFRDKGFDFRPGIKIKSDAPLDIPDSLYLFGNRELLLEVTGDGWDPGPFQSRGRLVIQEEPVDFHW